MLPTKDDIIAALKGVKDPELDLDIWTLGLIYGITIDEVEGITILMTLTTPFCPFGDEIVKRVEKALTPLHPEVRVDITFEPEWKPSDELRLMLGLTS
ncbi:MAG TPA: iron-sulfur cluster assembly protein [Candidatus Paceibacterota bacterium]|nr:iron-sulfur cluster assembly protein [Candidatus Paceibacterota bacterium]